MPVYIYNFKFYQKLLPNAIQLIYKKSTCAQTLFWEYYL